MTSSNPKTEMDPKNEFHLICLHGFLGLSTDWDLIAPVAPSPWTVHHENLWSQLSDLQTWGKQFCERMRALPGQKVLLGYSMGGRLVMQALQEDADLFSGAILVSANPGLKSEEEKQTRIQADHIWAEKFRKTPWDELMNQWNAQGVFNQPTKPSADHIVLARDESAFDRELLAEVLELWSLGYQRDFEPVLKELELPVLLLTGSADQKFTTLSAEIADKPAWGDRVHVVIEQAGHRVPWDSPRDFRAIVAKFLARWYRP